MTFAELANRVRAMLGQKHRYAHCVRVARMAENLARAHGADRSRARVAGMLHDLARLYDAQRLLDECAARKMTIDAYERRNPIVLHARLGAAIAREAFGVEDTAILHAIERHTVAAPRMSALDCIVYLADTLEPGRNFPGRARLAALAASDLHAAMCETLAATLAYHKQRGLAPSPQTLEAARAFGVRERIQPKTGAYATG